MRLINFLKPGLFLYECFRILVIFFMLAALKNNLWTSSWATLAVVLAAPAVLFPIMALFIWLDSNRYKAYLPLMAAGKIIGLFILLGYSIISQRGTMIEESTVSANFYDLLLCGDLFALAVVLMLIREDSKLNMED